MPIGTARIPRYFVVLAFLWLVGSVATPGTVLAQEGTSMKGKSSKLSQQAIRNDRKFKGDTPKSNRRIRRMLRFKMRSRQGDRPRKGDITGRKITRKVSPKPFSPSRKAVPNPYAGKPRKTEASAAKQAAQRARSLPQPYTATPKGERAFKGSVSGGKLRTVNTSSARKKVYRRPQVYVGQQGPTESDQAKRASKRARGGGKVSDRTITGKGKRVYRRPSPYAGRRPVSESDRARAAARIGGNIRSISQRQKPPSGVPAPRSITGLSRRITSGLGARKAGVRSISDLNRSPKKPTNIYAGKPRPTEAQRARSASKAFTQSRSVSGTVSFAGGKRKRPRSATVSGRAGKSKSPYGGGTGRRISPWERAHKGDITGRKLRTKNKSSVIPGIKKPTFNPYYNRTGTGEQAYSGRIRPRIQSISRASESKPGSRANISNRSITGQFKGPGKSSFNPYYGRKRTGDQAYQGRKKPKIQSVTRASESKPGSRKNISNRSITGQFKGPGKKSFEPYYGRRKTGDRPYMGKLKPRSNSITRSSESNPGSRKNIAADRSITAQFKGAGKKSFDPYYGRKKAGDQAYSGRMKPRSNSITRSSESNPGSRKNIAADRSITGQFKGAGKKTFDPYYGRKKGGDQAYSGKLKPRSNSITRSSESNPGSRKNIAADRSITGKIQGNVTPAMSPYYGKRKSGDQWYSGRITPKNKSITGKNAPHNTPVGKGPRSEQSQTAASFTGLMKAKKPSAGGGSLARNNWNNEAQSITVKTRSKTSAMASAYSGNLKAKKPLIGGGSVERTIWNNKEEPLQRIKQSPQIYYAVRYKGNKKESEVHPYRSTVYGKFAGRFTEDQLIAKQNTEYKNYSGTIKVVRKKGQGFHPSFYFHREDDNSLSEKKKPFSVKLWVGKLFRSNQPNNLRKKPGKLEFDKREEGLWYE